MRPYKKIRYLIFAGLATPLLVHAANHQILSWNNLGMHCMDSDYSVFSVLPPYNTIHAQLVVAGKLVTNDAGYSVTYEAVADPDGSFNSTSGGKTTFFEHCEALFGVALPIDSGLPIPGPDPFWMPGTNNTPQAMRFESGFNWLAAYGIPLTPYDDSGRKNPYPLMRLIARSSGSAIATNDIVLPVSDEMDCRACHASGSAAAAQPSAGWVWSGNPERDYRLNILRLHDEKNFAQHNVLYVAALRDRNFNALGLYRGVVADGKPVLCAACHASEALGTGSYSNTPALTASVHAKHADVMDPDLPLTLGNSANRAACYRCHPGSTTKCLRGAMGGAIAPDGTLEMQCQSCHGGMIQVGSSSRVGWLMEPNCQSCHTGTATSNNGQMRYTTAFTDTNWTVRIAENQTFATQSNTPAAGLSLYRFSAGHGGLQCSACHGSTHAEFPSTHRNDNLRNERIQGHAGVMIECTACHVSMTASASNAARGPHGMHPLGQTWVNAHSDLIEHGKVTRAQCRACHGSDYRGTVLSRAQATRTVSSDFGVKTYWRGQQVSCFDCHNGANSEDPASNTPPVARNVTTNTLSGGTVSMILPATDTDRDSLTFRIVAQPAHGSVGLSNNIATCFTEPGHVGTVTFTFAANDARTDSNLGTGIVSVAQGPYSIAAQSRVPAGYPARWPVPFNAAATLLNATVAPTFDWNFGDASPHSTNQNALHAFTQPGTYTWSVTVSAQVAATAVSTKLSGTIVIQPPVRLEADISGNAITLLAPELTGDVLLEETIALSPTSVWTVCPNVIVGGQALTFPAPETGAKFYRLRRVQ